MNGCTDRTVGVACSAAQERGRQVGGQEEEEEVVSVENGSSPTCIGVTARVPSWGGSVELSLNVKKCSFVLFLS